MAAISQPLSPEEYLDCENRSPTKNEYVNGRVIAMAGTTDTHNDISLNLAFLLRNDLRGTPCRAYMADVKVRLDRPNCFYYPDLLVTCDPRDRETPTYKRFPKLIVEILSPSTETRDRGQKFHHYQTLDSLEEYVLISSQQQQAETFHRQSDGTWHYQNYPTGPLTLNSFSLQIPFPDLYADTNVPLVPRAVPPSVPPSPPV